MPARHVLDFRTRHPSWIQPSDPNSYEPLEPGVSMSGYAWRDKHKDRVDAVSPLRQVTSLSDDEAMDLVKLILRFESRHSRTRAHKEPVVVLRESVGSSEVRRTY